MCIEHRQRIPTYSRITRRSGFQHTVTSSLSVMETVTVAYTWVGKVLSSFLMLERPQPQPAPFPTIPIWRPFVCKRVFRPLYLQIPPIPAVVVFNQYLLFRPSLCLCSYAPGVEFADHEFHVRLATQLRGALAAHTEKPTSSPMPSSTFRPEGGGRWMSCRCRGMC
jgi:hypothetical protein